MTTEILSTLLQASGAAGVTLMFVYHLGKKDKEFNSIVAKFNATINNYLRDANKTQANLAVQIHKFNETNKELKDALEKIYLHNKSIVDENKRLRAQGFGQSQAGN